MAFISVTPLFKSTERLKKYTDKTDSLITGPMTGTRHIHFSQTSDLRWENQNAPAMITAAQTTHKNQKSCKKPLKPNTHRVSPRSKASAGSKFFNRGTTFKLMKNMIPHSKTK